MGELDVESTRWLVAGLGNPGDRYRGTRHNVGFDVVQELVQRVAGSQSVWRDRDGALFTEVQLGNQRLVVVKPQRYMNLSGEPLSALQRFYKVPIAQVIVVHDEIDLPLGSLRLKRGGGDGGHNGLKSISRILGRDYFRVRVGIGRPPVGEGAGDAVRQDAVSNWVLGRFATQDRPIVDEAVVRASVAIERLIERGLEAAQREFNC